MTILEERPYRQQAADEDGERRRLIELAAECARYICARNPYLRMIAVSGSLCRPEHEGRHDDIDYFVVTRRGRIWEAFYGCLLHGWRFARSRGLHRTFFCFNYLVDEDEPQEIDLRRAEYVREFLRLHVLSGHATYLRLLRTFAARLQGVEPELYAAVLARTIAEAEREPPPVEDADATAYRLTAPLFRLLAKRMEARRRRRFPAGHIYSNARVIRSHFRRAWDGRPADEDGLPGAAAFDATAPAYQDVVASPANRHMRAVVREQLEPYVRPGMRVLDLGCGNGEDAIWLAQRGARVLAIDVSAGMIEAARRRVAEAGLGERIEPRRLAIENLSALLPQETGSFDLVLSNFGALNLAGEASGWAPLIRRLLKPEGVFVAGVMNRWCAPEIAAGLVRLRPGFALRRVTGRPIRVGGVALPARLYTPGGFEREVAPWLRALDQRGVCLLLPPPDLEAAAPALARSRLLAALDRIAGRLPLLRALGDHFVLTLRRGPEERVLVEGLGPVTASPVVDDVNGDGAPELIVAADRLSVLDAGGRPLAGWPRRPGDPMASTPLVLHDGERSLILAGSDDDRLHGYDLDGRRLPGFPLRTGGDVLSSPVSLDTPEGRRIVFGSDDGRLYNTELGSNVAPQPLLATDGFVSATPVVSRTEQGQAVFIASWDGNVYGLDAAGRLLPGWPRRVGFPVWNGVSIADVDGDGRAEVLVAAHKLFAFRGNGKSLAGFPIRLGGYTVGVPAAGRLRDGRQVIVVAADRLYAFGSDGASLPGFPLDLGACFWAAPLLVDVDGDGQPEIVAADMAGRVWAISAQGRVLDGWPLETGARIAATPCAADLDGDGYLELLVATWDGRVVVRQTGARAGDEAASPRRGFPDRRLPDEPILAGASPAEPDTRGDSGQMQELQPWPSAARVTAKSASEIHLELGDGCPVECGLLWYELDGRQHPSPLLGSRRRYFALVQPLRPLKAIDFHFEVRTAEGASFRVPATGRYRLRAGINGLRHIEASGT